jgi:cytochrome P450
VTVSAGTRTYPFNTHGNLDLDDAYETLRRAEPVCRVQLPYGEQAWLVTRHEDAKLVLSDPRFSREMAHQRDELRLSPTRIPPGGLLSTDPPDHTRLRRLVAKVFTARRVEQLRPRAQQIADDLVDQMLRKGPPAELVADFALPLPLTVICELLGVPASDRARVNKWSDAFLSTSGLSPRRRRWRMRRFGFYMKGLVAKRRRRPTDDLLGALVQARDNHDRLTERELIVLGVGLTAAGHESTVAQITNMVYLLLTRPELAQQLRAEPDRIPGAVEELMRYIPIGVGATFARYATEEVKVGDVVVQANEPVIISLGSVNRDGDVFPEPDRIDFGRPANPHLGFGHGVHHCVGAQLARMELQVSLSTLLTRLPQLRLAVPEQSLRWRSGMLVRGPRELPITWDRR